MKVMGLILCMLLAACTASPPPPPLMPIIIQSAPAPVSPPSAQTNPLVTMKVANEYQKAAQKEIPAVIAPDATPERVQSVHKADMAARRALRRLESQGHHPTHSTLDAARVAVKRLSDVLNSSNVLNSSSE